MPAECIKKFFFPKEKKERKLKRFYLPEAQKQFCLVILKVLALVIARKPEQGRFPDGGRREDSWHMAGERSDLKPGISKMCYKRMLNYMLLFVVVQVDFSHQRV